MSEIKWPHIETLNELGLKINDYGKQIAGAFGNLTRSIDQHVTQLQPEQQNAGKVRELKARSAALADDMISHYESLKPDNMLTPEELVRAKAVGLDENATIEEVLAAENAKNAADLAAAAEKEKADQEKAAADRLAKLKELGLKEDATDEEIEAAVKAKIAPAQQKHWIDELTDDFF